MQMRRRWSSCCSDVRGRWRQSPRPAAAWGFEAHKYIMARAIRCCRRRSVRSSRSTRRRIVEHAIDPDLWRTAGWDEEPPRHFVDMDAYGPYPFTELPHEYDEAVKRYGADFVAEERHAAVAHRGDLPEARRGVHARRRRTARDNIRFFSSVIAHYVADAHVPFHAALNYDGQLTGQWGIHSRFETRAVRAIPAPGCASSPQPVVPIAEPARVHLRDADGQFPARPADARRRQGRRRRARGLRRRYFTLFFARSDRCSRSGCRTRSPTPRR